MAEAGSEVFMLVVGRITDGEKIGAYQAALMESGLYPKHGGHYVAFGRPVEMFEGDWPDNQAIVVAKFPSLENAQAFWNSEEYQKEIKPLREGAGTFNVSVFPVMDGS
ncbi:MAG: DUF1330 domain-containing protein [Pseudomonadota bacterium]